MRFSNFISFYLPSIFNTSYIKTNSKFSECWVLPSGLWTCFLFRLKVSYCPLILFGRQIPHSTFKTGSKYVKLGGFLSPSQVQSTISSLVPPGACAHLNYTLKNWVSWGRNSFTDHYIQKALYKESTSLSTWFLSLKGRDWVYTVKKSSVMLSVWATESGSWA